MAAGIETGFSARRADAAMRRRSLSGVGFLTGIFLTLALATASATVTAQEEPFPLKPPDTTSPRGTLFNLIDNVVGAHRALSAAAREYEATPGLFKSEAVLEQEARAEVHLRRAVGSLNLSEISPATRKFLSLEAALQLKEVLDRVRLLPAEAIPDKQAVEAQGLTRWRVPDTNINIVQVAEGPRAGEFLLDPRTVAQAAQMYQTVRYLPYLTQETKGLYERHISSPGRLLPPKWLAWVEDLPAWTRTFYYGKTLWQWTALVLTLLVVLFVPYVLSRWLRRFRDPGSDFIRVLRRLAVPSVAIFGLWSTEYLLVHQLNFTGQGLIVVLNGLLVPITLLGAHISYLLALLVAESIIRSPRIDAASLDANMLRMIAGILGGALGLGIIFYGANHLGVPLVPLVASLGVGGLAVALAARPTLENLIGGIILYTDRPVRVGDFCSFGDHTGTVERIGVRSIQIRARDRTIITVPNATFADMEIINWARCDMMQILATIGLRYETKLEQLRYVLAKLREMCLAHPKIDNDTRRIRFIGYGSTSLDIQIRIYALTRDWNEFFAIQEDVMLRVGEIVEEAGTSFAFPSRTVYLGRDGGLDEERGAAAMHQVRSWRGTGQLPFPNMASSRREQLADTLDYPPRGSPDAFNPESLEGEAAEPLSAEAESGEQPCEPESPKNS
ncbi:MAG: mechanosensitive ion channel [Gammaproteobacteria bacterium]|nr:mechanosensitive ion channel [Gammaproteobacteria bacterium]